MEVDGIPLGEATPAVFFGPRGRRVRVVVRLRGVERSRELSLGEVAEVGFSFPSTPTPKVGGAAGAVSARSSGRSAPKVARPRRRTRPPRHRVGRPVNSASQKEATIAPKAPIKPPVLIVPAPKAVEPVKSTKAPPKKAPKSKAPAAKDKPKAPVGEGTLGW